MNIFFFGFSAENCLLSFFLPDVMQSHCGMLLLFSCSSLLPISECEQVLFPVEAAERCIQHLLFSGVLCTEWTQLLEVSVKLSNSSLGLRHNEH